MSLQQYYELHGLLHGVHLDASGGATSNQAMLACGWRFHTLKPWPVLDREPTPPKPTEGGHYGRRSRNGAVLHSEPHLYTVDEFYALIEDGQKADLIDGVIYVASPDTKTSDRLSGFLFFLISGFADARELGDVSGSRFAYRLTEHRAPEPDIAFVSRERVIDVVTEREGVGPPDLAVEIVSRDSKTRDYQKKKALYEESGVREYWIIDPLAKRAQFWMLGLTGYELMSVDADGVFRSQALAGFWLKVGWLFGKKLPAKYDCLQQILNG